MSLGTLFLAGDTVFYIPAGTCRELRWNNWVETCALAVVTVESAVDDGDSRRDESQRKDRQQFHLRAL
ncbi:hypothetical protein PGT21_008554 [Puccinia graminis f. sp. tritici]|uniref:Uncharacterized protein n=1 Tax=Puccinia graminis f. sp. tritici TaxID=56615 RepID=A0A5B0PX40_PUCGR|nr:hypothetical protein PGTUg99_030481 [Puccinia graminis f. sp. tritici]KAA1105475.1 hypothetical protein PGT21_008554 [Puccinia graminis f. sp. tritici]